MWLLEIKVRITWVHREQLELQFGLTDRSPISEVTTKLAKARNRAAIANLHRTGYRSIDPSVQPPKRPQCLNSKHGRILLLAIPPQSTSLPSRYPHTRGRMKFTFKSTRPLSTLPIYKLSTFPYGVSQAFVAKRELERISLGQ